MSTGHHTHGSSPSDAHQSLGKTWLDVAFAEFLFESWEIWVMQISNHMSVSGVDSIRAASKSNAPVESAAPSSDPGIASVSDQLDLSPEALAIGTSSGDSIRAERVAHLKQIIAEGTYDTDALLDQALSKMIDQLS